MHHIFWFTCIIFKHLSGRTVPNSISLFRLKSGKNWRHCAASTAVFMWYKELKIIIVRMYWIASVPVLKIDTLISNFKNSLSYVNEYVSLHFDVYALFLLFKMFVHLLDLHIEWLKIKYIFYPLWFIYNVKLLKMFHFIDFVKMFLKYWK